MTLFVGRTAELRKSLDLLATSRDGVVQDVVGVHGIGKSFFLNMLAEEAAQLDRTQVFSVDMKRHGLGEGFHNDFGARASTAVLVETFNRSRELMKLFADPPYHEFDAFREAAQFQSRRADRVLYGNALNIGRRGRVEKAEITNVVEVGDEEVRRQIREAQNEIDDAFLRAWTEFTLNRRVLITVDTFELIADDEMGQWMTRLALRLPRTLISIARTPSDHTLGTYSAQFQQVPLDNFTPAEVSDYLARRFHPEALIPGIADVAHAFTDGHPGGVTLVADLIAEKGPSTLDPPALRRLLDRLPSDPEQRWAELVNMILEAVREPRLRQGVEAASITSTFDGKLLADLMRADGVDDGRNTGDIIGKLRGLRLLQQVPALSGEPSDRFRLHEFIRRSVSLRLRTHHRHERWLPLHRAAAEHYYTILRGWEDENYDSYGSWYRFEDPAWQEQKREWLFHSGMLSSRRAVTRARFTLVFLESVWWWASYLPFPLTRRLLEDWGRASEVWSGTRSTAPVSLERRKSDDQQLTDALTFLLDNYPVSYLKPASAPWDALRSKLLLIRRLCGLRGTTRQDTTPEEAEDMARTDALITVFLAHTRRFKDPSDPRAESYYEEAINRFEQLDDEWNTAWMYYEHADLALERHDLDQTMSRIAECGRRARALAERTEEWDHELLANAHRTQADVFWAREDLPRAAAAYGRAIAHAYWFQGEPHAPDEYTQQFYVEITTRAAERVADLADRPPLLRRFVDLLLEEVPRDKQSEVPDVTGLRTDLARVRSRLFPAGPTADEMRLEESPFMDDWNVLFEDAADPAAGLDVLVANSEVSP
ncbi:hypothetical protein [Actinomadura chokoriensis]|uniref:ATP-binding protein n=1 Tax=Actinomadura chokoriensis TaxID=454156 RepID=A0ABV4R1Q9_9ACTN